MRFILSSANTCLNRGDLDVGSELGTRPTIAESAAVRADAADAAAGLSATDARLSVRKLDLAGVRVNPRRFVVPLPGVILAIIGAVIAFSGSEVTTYDDGSVSAEGGNPVGVIVMVVGILAIFLIEVWNLVFRQGNTGQTLGKKWLGISVIRESDGVPLGPVMALLRWIMMAILGGACFLNYLWPLWDSKHQCWHDMVVRSVVVRAR